MKFFWDGKKNKINIKKHGVSFQVAAQVFFDDSSVIFFDQLHSDNEQRFVVIGLSSDGLLFVVFVEKTDDLIRIISARKATKKERGLYEEKK